MGRSKRWDNKWWRHLNPEKYNAYCYLNSENNVRENTLETIKNREELDDNERLLAEQASKYIDESKILLNKNSFAQAYRSTLTAERRILFLLLEKREQFPSVIKAKRDDYWQDAKQLRNGGRLENDEKEVINRIFAKENSRIRTGQFF